MQVLSIIEIITMSTTTENLISGFTKVKFFIYTHKLVNNNKNIEPGNCL